MRERDKLLHNEAGDDAASKGQDVGGREEEEVQFPSQ